MFTTKKQNEQPGLEEAIAEHIAELRGHPASSETYSDLLTKLERLHAMRVIPKQEARKPVSSDALVAVAGNLLGIVAILSYERVHVVTSKALGFVLKTKV